MEHFTAVFEQDGEWWVGYVEELPGANTQGRTLDEARENLREAAQLIVEANRELADGACGAGMLFPRGTTLLIHEVVRTPGQATKIVAEVLGDT